MCESVYNLGTFCVIIGIGLNLSNTTPTTCLESIRGEKVNREEFLAEFLNHYSVIKRDFIGMWTTKYIRGNPSLSLWI